MQPRSALLIENPAASKSSKSELRVAERALASVFDLTVATTKSPHDAEQLAISASNSSVDTVICYGGDGTVHEVINGLLHSSPTTNVRLGVLPGGGTNVVARRLGYPNNLIGATEFLCDAASRNRVKKLGVGHLEFDGSSRYFVFGAGMGFDAEMVRRMLSSKSPSSLRDVVFVVKGFLAFSKLKSLGSPPLVVEGTPAWWTILSLGDPYTYLGRGAFRVTPKATGNGIDCVSALSARLPTTLGWILSAFTTGRHLKHPEISYVHNVESIDIKASPPIALQADGEYLGEVHEMSARFVPTALTVWA